MLFIPTKQQKSLRSTLAKVASFIEDIEDGIAANEFNSAQLQEQIDVIEAERKVNTNEISLGQNLLRKLSI